MESTNQLTNRQQRRKSPFHKCTHKIYKEKHKRCHQYEVTRILPDDDKLGRYIHRESHGKPVYTTWFRKTGAVDWNKTFQNMYNDHSDKYTTDLQYKLIHHGVATRKRLHAANLSESPLMQKKQKGGRNGRTYLLEMPHGKTFM